MKSEPDCYSYQDLAHDPEHHEPWDGVRNYQARNFMHNMKLGDLALFYHSNTKPPHVAGVMKVAKEAYPDATAWDMKSDHPDEKSTSDNPRWYMVDVQAVREFEQKVPLETLRATASLSEMQLLARGNRLSIIPVSEAEFCTICELGGLTNEQVKTLIAG